MRLGLFLGSFDPIHLGHTQIAEKIINEHLVDDICWVVSPHSPEKDPQYMVSAEMRLEMVRLAIEHYPRWYASDMEFFLPQPSYTIHTLKKLHKDFPEKELFILMGNDNYAKFNTWKSYKEILSLSKIIVYPRETIHPSTPSWVDEKTLKEKIMPVKECPLYGISSTEIRTMFKEKHLSPKDYLCPKVFAYIEKNKLYQKK